jgi:predicted permease
MMSRLLRLALRLLPEEFRSSYGRDIETTFRAECQGLSTHASIGVWTSTVADVLRRAPGIHWDILRRDGRLALRTLSARPMSFGAAVLMLAIGIGANVAVYTVVHTVLLAPLPYQHADALVTIAETEAGADPSNLGYLTFVDIKDRARSLDQAVAATQSSATMTGEGLEAERLNAMRVSREYFEMIGVMPALGRPFTAEEDRPGEARRVVILSDALWRRRFGADPGVINQAITISDLPYRIVGVLPAGFEDLVAGRLYNDAEVWFPLGYDPAASFACRTCRHLRVFGRLAPGVTVEQSAAELDAIVAGLEQEHPTEYTQAGIRVQTLRTLFLGPVRPVMIALWFGVAALLLVACGNVAHLLLLRASEREQEVAVRRALGVTRTRLVRQFLTESLLLACAGGVAGLGLAWVAVRVIALEGPTQIPRLSDIALTADAVWIGLILTALSGLTAGLVPLRHLLRHADGSALRSGTRGTDTSSTWRTRAVLVGANVALAFVLLVGSGLLVRSMSGLLAVEPGLNPNGVLTMQVWASGARFRAGDTSDQITTAGRFYDDILTPARALPGVVDAAAVTTLPLGGNVDGYSIHVLSQPEPESGRVPSADRFSVTPGFFNTLRIGLVRGRYLTAADRQGAEPVAVIGATAAATLFGNTDPIGQQIALGPRDAQPRTIVGIVDDVRHHGLDHEVGPQVYVPHAQWAWADTFLTILVRTDGDAAALARPMRAAVAAVDPNQPVTDIATYDEIVALTTGTRRFTAALLSAFAGTSLLMVVIGLYGSVGVLVSQRRREIGVRLALGASAAGIRRLILSRGLMPVALGLLVGVCAAAVAVQALESLLYGIDPVDAPTFAGAVVTLSLCAAIACLLPARRAGRIDPAATLRG